MEKECGRPKILIVNGYHPKEIFAVQVGEYLLRHFSYPYIKIVNYTGKPDETSTNRNLRQFVAKFDPALSVILHGDDDLGVDVVILYRVHSKKEKRKLLKPMFDFVSDYHNKNRHKRWAIFDIEVTSNAKYALIDLELNSKMGLKRAADFIRSFAKYLLKGL